MSTTDDGPLPHSLMLPECGGQNQAQSRYSVHACETRPKRYQGRSGHIACNSRLVGGIVCPELYFGRWHWLRTQVGQPFSREESVPGCVAGASYLPLGTGPLPSLSFGSRQARPLLRQAMCRRNGPTECVAHFQPCPPPGLSKRHMAVSRVGCHEHSSG